MSISSISSASTITSFLELGAPAPSKPALSTLVSRLEGSISAGDMNATKTLLDQIKSLVPPDPGSSNPLSGFLNSVEYAVKDNSTSEAQTALSTYQAAIAPPAKPTASPAEVQSVAEALTQDKQTSTIIKMALDPLNTNKPSTDSTNTDTATSTAAATSPSDSLLSLLGLPASSDTTGTLFNATA